MKESWDARIPSVEIEGYTWYNIQKPQRQRQMPTLRLVPCIILQGVQEANRSLQQYSETTKPRSSRALNTDAVYDNPGEEEETEEREEGVDEARTRSELLRASQVHTWPASDRPCMLVIERILF